MSELFDVIVVGSGISGGIAAKELTEQGLSVLLLERGRPVKHGQYPTANMEPWDLPHRGQVTQSVELARPINARTGFLNSPNWAHWFTDEDQHPYNEAKPFDWLRGYHTGGRSITWGRHCYRFSDLDFSANQRENIGIDWPIRYQDLAPWYDHIDDVIGISGEALGLTHLPDSRFLPPLPLNVAEEHLKSVMQQRFDRHLTVGRIANLTGGATRPGRGTCVNRDKCMHGCPIGGYYSSLSGALPVAEATGRLTLRNHAIVHKVIYDQTTQRATGVEYINELTGETHTSSAKVIFLCASAIASASILLQSRCERFPNGLGNDSDQVGRNIMDHHMLLGAQVRFPEAYRKYRIEGKRPTGFYIPRFQNLEEQTPSAFKRGYGYQGWTYPAPWDMHINDPLLVGTPLLDRLREHREWMMRIIGFGEMLPNPNNRMVLNYEKTDQWGLPTVTFDVTFGENEKVMHQDMARELDRMLKEAGFELVSPIEKCTMSRPGQGIHEMGTARMGHDPATSVLNKHNQIHACPNVYITDGACMTSSGCQNPSYTYMALTARAAHHASKLIKGGAV